MNDLSRRGFLATASTLPLTAASAARVIGANDRLQIGVIGCGGMAGGHMRALNSMKESDNCRIVAVCDVYDKRLDAAAELTGGQKYKEYRRLLENKDIDYVLIATPEHWHAQMTLDAADMGKHIYCEKPMTWNIEQAKKVVAKIKSTGVKMQVGVQGMSDDSYEAAHKLVKDGALGKVVLAQIDYSRNHKGDEFWAYPIDADCKPGVNLDWNAWLGPAKKRPFHAERFFRWRLFWDYSGGIATDLFIHRVTRIIKSLGLTFPERGVGSGGKFYFSKSMAEVPDTLNFLLDYPEGLTVQLVSSMANDMPVEHMLRGNKATLTFTRTGFSVKPQKLYEDEVKPVEFTKTGAESVNLHHRNLQGAIRKGEALKCDCDLGYYGVVAAAIGNESYRRRAYLAWDRNSQRLKKA
jgi:predicted dehydrogenase